MSETINVYTAYNHEPCSLGVDAYTRGHLWSDKVSYTTTTMKTTLHMRGRSGDANCKYGRLADWGLFLKVMVDGKWSKQFSTKFNYCQWRADGADWTYTFDRKYSTYTVPVKGSYAYYPYSTAKFHYTSVQNITVPAQPVIKPATPTISVETGTIKHGQDAIIVFSKDTEGGRKGSHRDMRLKYKTDTKNAQPNYPSGNTHSSAKDNNTQSNDYVDSSNTKIRITKKEIEDLFPNGQGGTLYIQGVQCNIYDGKSNYSATREVAITVEPANQFEITKHLTLKLLDAPTTGVVGKNPAFYHIPSKFQYTIPECKNGTLTKLTVSYSDFYSDNYNLPSIILPLKNSTFLIDWQDIFSNTNEWQPNGWLKVYLTAHFVDKNQIEHTDTAMITLTAQEYQVVPPSLTIEDYHVSSRETVSTVHFDAGFDPQKTITGIKICGCTPNAIADTLLLPHFNPNGNYEVGFLDYNKTLYFSNETSGVAELHWENHYTKDEWRCGCGYIAFYISYYTNENPEIQTMEPILIPVFFDQSDIKKIWIQYDTIKPTKISIQVPDNFDITNIQDYPAIRIKI